jgi:hypothetical protein
LKTRIRQTIRSLVDRIVLAFVLSYFRAFVIFSGMGGHGGLESLPHEVGAAPLRCDAAPMRVGWLVEPVQIKM